ncbi:hypothetical protein FKP32DRAFT_1633183, partial [Trametes sanguinea]
MLTLSLSVYYICLISIDIAHPHILLPHHPSHPGFRSITFSFPREHQRYAFHWVWWCRQYLARIYPIESARRKWVIGEETRVS